jgi:hypothetical protein
LEKKGKKKKKVRSKNNVFVYGKSLVPNSKKGEEKIYRHHDFEINYYAQTHYLLDELI